MDPHKFYIEQTTFDGRSYTQGTLFDTYATWGIVCSKSPFRYFGDPKDVASRNWLDQHGEDVYIPSDIKLKKYDAEFTFLCNGTESNVKFNVRNFLLFLMGMRSKKREGKEEVTIPAIGARLAMFDEYTDIGWKDVRYKASSTDGLVMDNADNEVILEFKVTFEIFDPYTEVNILRPVGGGDPRLIW